MLHTEHAYHEAGYKCARARLQSDEACAQHWKRWFTGAQALERDADRQEARRLFDQGYSEAQPARRWSLP
jgi:hypothetical protein